jgi:hypothetical protein
MWMKSALLIGILSGVAVAEVSPSVTKFSGQILSKTPYRLKFQAPVAHHFNQEAPAKVEIVDSSQTTAGKIEKTLPVITVEFPNAAKISSGCLVKAQLFVCDDAGTYCQPVKQEFDCQKLQAKN